jgi:hypothetical protein
MQRRRLTAANERRHEHSVKRVEQLERTQRKRKLLGSRRDRQSWVDNLVTLVWYGVALVGISIAYHALPPRFHFSPTWQEPAEYVMFGSVLVAVVGREWWRKAGFWAALPISSVAHAIIIHGWIVRVGSLQGRHRGDAKLAMLLGPILFLVVYLGGYFLHKMLSSEELIANP